MRTLNFLVIFFQFGQLSEKYVSDVLCGTKCFKRKSWTKYEEFKTNSKLMIYGNFIILHPLLSERKNY